MISAFHADGGARCTLALLGVGGASLDRQNFGVSELTEALLARAMGRPSEAEPYWSSAEDALFFFLALLVEGIRDSRLEEV